MDDAYEVKGGGRACRQCKKLRPKKFCDFSVDGWCKTHSTVNGPVYCK